MDSPVVEDLKRGVIKKKRMEEMYMTNHPAKEIKIQLPDENPGTA